MFGTPRDRVSRLLAPVYDGQDYLILPTGLDWTNGDYLGLPATNTNPYDSETVQIESYDSQSGLV